MATMNKFPPDVPKDWDEAEERVGDEAATATGTLRAKAAELTDRATEKVKGGYERAREAVAEMDPVETMREGGEAAIRTVERHPFVAFGLGALSVGLIAWASLRERPVSRWERYQPDLGRWRSLLDSYAGEASRYAGQAGRHGETMLKSGEEALRAGRDWLDAHGSDARSYTEQGSRYIARRAQKEPVAALLGVGIAIYVIGSLLGSASSTPAPARRRGTKR